VSSGATALAQQVMTSFDPPGSIYTAPSSINSAGAIAGLYFDGDRSHGFVRDPNGGFTSFDPPGSIYTAPVTIDDQGKITGFCLFDAGGAAHGFVRDAQGGMTFIDTGSGTGKLPSGTFASGSFYFQPASINTAGTTAGTYIYNYPYNTYAHGFIQDQQGGMTLFDAPGSFDTEPRSINAAGFTTGIFYSYVDGTQSFHSFTRDVTGNVTVIDVPSSLGTAAVAVNAAGTITGHYLDADSISHGFVYQLISVPSTLNAAYVGITGQDYVGPLGQLTPDGVPDGHIQLRGLRGIPTKVRITNTSGSVWETPYNGLNWVIYNQYGSSGAADLWLEPSGSSGYHVKVWYSDSTTDEADAL
jgi:hypothetical protein